jgi:hypothetical protein
MKRLGAALTFVLLVACAGGLSSAKGDYRRGRYAEAKEKLLSLEAERDQWDGAKRAEYALYRGLVHQALGDRGAAGVWLREAKAIEDVHPHTLQGEDKVRLDLALESIGPTPAPP